MVTNMDRVVRTTLSCVIVMGFVGGDIDFVVSILARFSHILSTQM